MSGVALTALAAAGGSLIGFFKAPTRLIGPIIPGIVLEEQHEDRLTITEHPIERGANITDHAFKEAARCEIQCQWSNTQAGLFDFSESYIIQQYVALLNLQFSRLPITIVTGKRIYNNMLIETITTQTDRKTAFCLPVALSCREAILVQTSTTTLPPQDQHIDPQQTAPVIGGGNQALTGTGSGSQSILLQSAQALGLAVPAAGSSP